MVRRAALFLLVLLLPLAASSATNDRAAAPIAVTMRDVTLYPLDDAPALVAQLTGTVVPTERARIVNFDDVKSYAIEVQDARVQMSAAAMTALMNEYLLQAADGPIRKVELRFGDGRIEMSGTMVKLGAPVPFTAAAVAEPTERGELRLRITEMKAAGVVPKGLMDALGLTMDKVAQPDNPEVFHIVGDDLIVPVVTMFPPPRFRGRLRSVRVTPDALVAEIGGERARDAAPRATARSFIAYQGGTLHFAKLTMSDVDLTVLPKEDGAQLGFSPANYYRQMQAGLTLPQPDRGLVARVPDYATVRTRQRADKD